MSDDRENQNAAKTVPPPEGEEDAYSAATKVGRASDELLAKIRAEMERQPSEPRMKTPAEDDAPPISLTGLEVVEEEEAPPPRRNKSIPPPVPKKSTPPPAVSEEPKAVAEERKPEAPPGVASKVAASNEERPVTEAPAGKGLAPVIGIALVFALAIVLLAALVR